MPPNAPPEVLILSTIPAPYRTKLFDLLQRSEFVFRVALERSTDAERNTAWLVRDLAPNYTLLDTAGGRRQYRSLMRRIRTFHSVIVYEYSTVTAIRLMLTCIVKDVPYLINCDGAVPGRRSLRTPLKRYVIRHARACLAGSQAAKDYFASHGASADRIHRHDFTSLTEADILSAPPSEAQKIDLRRSLGLPVDGRMVVCAGQFIPRKGFDVLLRAWKLRNSEADDYLVLIGEGPELPTYREYMRDHLVSNVHILSFMDNRRLFNHFAAADLFAFPTRLDIWGLVVNEAMACGLPVIVSDACVAGLELVVEGSNGRIVPVDDAERLAAALDEVLADDSVRKRMAANALATVRARTIRRVADAHIETLSRLNEGS